MTPDADAPRNKVQKVMEKRELTGLGEALEQRWHGLGYEEHSIRELTSVFNRLVIEQAIRSSGEASLDGETEHIHEMLTNKSIGSEGSMQAPARLANYGIDIDKLESDMVSHQTMYRFLKNIRNVDTSADKKSVEDRIEAIRRSLRKLQSRTQSVATQNLTQLNNRPEFTIGDFDVFVDIRVVCNDCDKSGEITQILDNRGCDCNSIEE